MNFNDFKLYAINTTTLGVTTFTEIEMGFKIAIASSDDRLHYK